MQLFIPEIGDKFRVTSKITLTLMNERRNDSILLNVHKKQNVRYNRKEFLFTLPESEIAMKLYNEIYKRHFNNETQNDITKYKKKANAFRKYKYEIETLQMQYIENIRRFNNDFDQMIKNRPFVNCKGVKNYPFELRQNDILTIDRIYIRKGSKEYSSVSFYLKRDTLGKSRMRFWIPLGQVGKINLMKV